MIPDAIVMAVPGFLDVASAGIERHKPHAFFEQAARNEALALEISRALVVEAYISFVAAHSLSRSTTSEAAVCMRYASSYGLMRTASSLSLEREAKCCSFRFFSKSSDMRCVRSVVPVGVVTESRMASTSNVDRALEPILRVFRRGYAGLWKVTFESNSLRGPVLNNESKSAVFEARLNQNLDFKAKFPTEKIMGIRAHVSALANPAK